MSLRKKFFSNPFVLTVIAIILGFGVAALILLAAGYPPVESIRTLAQSMVGRPKDISSAVRRLLYSQVSAWHLPSRPVFSILAQRDNIS